MFVSLCVVSLSNTSTAMVAAVPDPTPSNNDITRVTISGLTSGNTYSIAVWCISQAGIASAVPATLSWQVVPSAPDAVAIDKPDANSGSAQPMFTFGVQWVNSSVPTGAANITFQVGVHAVFPCTVGVMSQCRPTSVLRPVPCSNRERVLLCSAFVLRSSFLACPGSCRTHYRDCIALAPRALMSGCTCVCTRFVRCPCLVIRT